MRERMISHHVPGFHKIAHDVGALLHIPANEEKRGPHILPRQNLHQSQRIRIVGAVVVGERDLF